jgi:hypothetical protein
MIHNTDLRGTVNISDTAKYSKRTAKPNITSALLIRTIIVRIDASPEYDVGWRHRSGMNDVNMQPVLVLRLHGLFECYWIKMSPSLSAQTGVVYVTCYFRKSGAQEQQCHGQRCHEAWNVLQFAEYTRVNRATNDNLLEHIYYSLVPQLVHVVW